MSSSLDNGATWKKPVLVSRIAGPVWMEVDNNPASPFLGTIYIATSRLSPGLYNVVVFYSRDGGKTWQSQVVDRTSGQINESPTSLALASDGTVYVAMSKCKYLGEVGCETEISSISKSIDGGNSWSIPSQVAVARIPFVGFDIQLNFSPVLAVDNSNGPMRGTIYLVDYTQDQTHGYIAVTSSPDGGASWSPPVHVSNSGAGFQVYQAASVSDDGVLAITWLQLQPDNHYRPFCATSKDGRTFSSGVLLSQNFSQVGYHTGFFRSQAWVGKTLYSTWIDSDNNYQVTIGGVQFSGVQF